MSEDDVGLLLSEGKAFWVGGAFQSFILGLRAECDSAFEAKEDAIKVVATIASWAFFFFWRGEGVTKAFEQRLDEALGSFSKDVISFSIEDLSFSNEGSSFLREEISLEVSESNEKHDSRSERAFALEASSWSRVSDEGSESRFSIFSVDE